MYKSWKLLRGRSLDALSSLAPIASEKGTQKSEFWSQTHVGSNTSFRCCVTLGKSLHLSEPHFPLQREPYTLVHRVVVKN